MNEREQQAPHSNGEGALLDPQRKTATYVYQLATLAAVLMLLMTAAL